MNIKKHFYFAYKPAILHFAVSLMVAAIATFVVFGIWYPAPLDQLADGRTILWILVCVDLISGPVLTLIVAAPDKGRLALWGDLAVICLIQLAALSYGVLALYDARPVYLAYEGDRFRVVSVPDIDPRAKTIGEMVNEPLPLWGPKPIGVRLLDPSDPTYLHSLQQAVAGNHPAFRPDRWLPYSNQRQQILREASPLSKLVVGGEVTSQTVSAWLERNNQTREQVMYLPLANHKQQDWIVLLRKSDAELIGFLALDGWN